MRTRERSQEFSDGTRQVLGFYESWREQTGRYLDVLLSACPGSSGTATFTKLFGAADIYARLYEFWEPLARAIQERAGDLEAYREFLDPARCREATDRIFGFGGQDASAHPYARASELLETWGAKGQAFLGPWSDAMRASAEAALAAASGDPNAGVAAFRSLYAAFDQTFGKALDMPAVGRDREHHELLSRAIDRYAVFLAKNAELQRRMQTIAQQAMEKVVETMAQKIQAGKPIKGFGEFVQTWTTINEEAFLEFFQTEEFSQLQGLVLDAAIDCRKEIHQLMEVSLKEFPIALRSEMDDIASTNYTLKKSVRSLRKKSAEIDDLHREVRALQRRVAELEKQLAADEATEGGNNEPAEHPEAAAKTTGGEVTQ
jgi:hypothetical protein